MINKVLPFIVVAALVSGCSSTGQVSKPQPEMSQKVITGQQHEFTLFRRFFRNEQEKQASRDVQLINDPEYQEFLEWRQWKRFKAYQEWKKQNAGAS